MDFKNLILATKRAIFDIKTSPVGGRNAMSNVSLTRIPVTWGQPFPWARSPSTQYHHHTQSLCVLATCLQVCLFYQNVKCLP